MLILLCLLLMVMKGVFSKISPFQSLEQTLARQSVDDFFNNTTTTTITNNRKPSQLLNTARLKQISNILPLFKQLPEPIVQRAVDLYKQGQIDKLMELLTSIDKLVKRYQLQKCKAIFSFHLCSNSSAQPFFLWAKMSANKIVKG